jgi:hypothetical protein
MGDKPMKKSKYLALKSNSKGSKVVQIFESEEEILARGSEDGFDDEEMTYMCDKYRSPTTNGASNRV